MRTFNIPNQDASLYQQFPTRNTGGDEILEIGKTNNGVDSVRSVIQFDLTTISASLVNGTIPFDASYDLMLYVANATEMQDGQQLECKPLSQSWAEGTGYFYQDIYQIANGVSWQYNMTASVWTVAGGSTQSLDTVSTSLGNPVTDITMDVSSIVQSWLSGSYPNNGIVVKFPDMDEASVYNMGNIKFFSKQTHTIYRPTLVVKWNDQVYTTGSLPASPTSSLFVTPFNLKAYYRQNDMVRVDLIARERFPLKTFNTIFTNYEGLSALPSSSYFSIIDEQSGTVIIPFDSCSCVSVDGNSSYVKFTVQNMYPLRYYRLIIKVDHDGLSEIFDGNSVFTIRQ